MVCIICPQQICHFNHKLLRYVIKKILSRYLVKYRNTKYIARGKVQGVFYLLL